MSANTYQPWTRDSSTASEIEKFERISLNNLLLKCKGAPYEDALRRIIKQKLADNFLKAKAGDEVRENGREAALTMKVYRLLKAQRNVLLTLMLESH